MQTRETEAKEDPDFTASTTTTTITPILAAWENLPNPCKFRGDTIEILEALYDCGAMSTREIANITAIDINEIGDRLRKGGKRGIFFRVDRWKWGITDYGSFIYEINKDKIKKSITNRDRTVIESITNRDRTLDSEKKQRQLRLDIFLEKEDLTEDERIVVVAMVRHYEDSAKRGTPRPYIFVRDYYEFRTETGLNTKLSEEDVQDIVFSLDAAGILFRVPQGRQHIKIGLTKKTIENMRNA